MAVIREQRQFKIGPIGVARASRGGEIVGEAVARSAAQAQQYFTQRAAEDARQAGIETAQALEASEVIALDPETGKPTVYDGPQGFGRIARNAYNQVLLNRFEQEIATELEDKSRDLALKFKNSPEGFRTAMSDYIAEMTNVQESTVFKQEILRMGKALQSSNYRSLQAQAAARQAAADKLAYSNARADNIENIRNSYAVGNVTYNEFGDPINLGDNMVIAGENLDKTNVKAGVVSSQQVRGNKEARNMAKAEGLLSFELKQAVKLGDETKLAQALNAIDAGDMSLMPEGYFPQLTEHLSQQGFTFRGKFAAYGVESIQDGINQVSLADEIARRERALATEEFDAASTYFNSLSSDPTDLLSSFENAASDYMQDVRDGKAAYKQGKSQEVVASYTAQSGSKLQSLASALTNQLVYSVDSVEGLNDIQTYLKNPTTQNQARLSDESLELADGLIKVSRQTGQIKFLDDADKFAESITDETRFREEKNRIEAAINFDGYMQDTGNRSIDRAKTKEELSEAENSIYGGSDSGYNLMSKEDKARYNGAIKDRLSEGYFRLAFASAKTQQVISDMQIYARDKNADVNLSKEQKELIDKATSLSQNPSATTTNLNKFAATAQAQYEKRVVEKDNQKVFEDLQSGIISGKDLSAEQRKMVEQKLNIPSDFYTNSKYDDPEYAGLNVIISQMSASYMPQALENDIKSFLGGRITDTEQVQRLLTMFANTSSYVTDRGSQKTSAAINQLDSQTLALMNEAVAFAKNNRDVQAMTQHLDNVQRAMADPTLSEAMNKFFTRSQSTKENRAATKDVYSYVIANFPEAATNSNLRDRLISEARVHYFSSISESNTGNRFDNLDERLQDVVDSEYIEDERIVAMDGSNKTLYPLSETVKGYEDQFIKYVRDSLKINSTNKDVDWDSVEFKLMPVGFNSEDRGMTYGVVIVDELGTRNLQEVEMFIDPDGEGFVAPAFFSTNEPMFAAIKGKREEIVKAEKIQQAESMEKDFQKATKTLQELEQTYSETIGAPPSNELPPNEQATFDKLMAGDQPPIAYSEAQAQIKQIVNVDKYSQYLTGVDLSKYKLLLVDQIVGNKTNMKIVISNLLNTVASGRTPWANELEVDLENMLDILERVE